MKKITKALVALAALTVTMLVMSTGILAAEATLVSPNMYYGNEKAATRTYTYNQNKKLSDGNSYYGVVIPVKVTAAGTVRFDFKFTTMQKDVDPTLYSDAACTNVIDYMTSYNVGEVSGTEYCSLTNAGTYYLKLKTYAPSYSSTPIFTNSIVVSARTYTRSDKTIKSGQTITYYRNSSDDVYWFKYKAEKTGKATVSFTRKYGSHVTLCNSKKKALTDEEWVSSSDNYKAVFAVKKGTTYYFKVTAIGSDEVNTISVKNTAIKEKSGSKRKKAVTVKAKKKVKGTILPASKTSDWYKFKVKKKKKVTLYLDGEVTGYIRVTAYNSKGKEIDSYLWNGGSDKLQLSYGSYGKANKGTYYIKFSRYNSKSSGHYSFKWK